jgi:hypothetical protein
MRWGRWHLPMYQSLTHTLSGGRYKGTISCLSNDAVRRHVMHEALNLHHLTYMFGGFSFEQFGPDGPWVFFDDERNTFIFSHCKCFAGSAANRLARRP